ncbi:MAG: DUF2284 domain-containing protein [Lachnospiraceae bacterium]|nr:DUF2284 domain-containing protein [Lachnospiraceae bacterium]
MQKNVEIAKECGFTNAGVLNVDTLIVKQEVRDMCEMNTCNKYGKNWACPPACGSLEDCGAKLKKYTKGIIVQTTRQLEDSMDFEGLEELEKDHRGNFKKAVDRFSEMYPGMLPLGAGTCSLCKECTYPDNECRFPNKRISSMEAFGLVVNEVCKANDLPYNYGPNTMTYIGCFLFE